MKGCRFGFYILKAKFEAFRSFSHFKRQVELQLGTSLKILQIDWSGELRSFTSYLDSIGVIFQKL